MTPEQVLGYGLQFIAVVLVPIMWYLFRQQQASKAKLFERYDSIRNDFQKAQLAAAEKYMPKSEIRQLIETAMEPVKKSLERIERNQDKILNGR